MVLYSSAKAHRQFLAARQSAATHNKVRASRCFKPQGFTLIELLVVLTIGMLLVSLGAGLEVDMVEKTQIQRDTNRLKMWSRDASFRSYLCGCDINVILDGANITLIQNQRVIKATSFDKIVLPYGMLQFRKSGLHNVSTLHYQVNGQDKALDLNKVLNEHS
jgi:prepilin-type N-terminal cleavage/methylation domain-containing protein